MGTYNIDNLIRAISEGYGGYGSSVDSQSISDAIKAENASALQLKKQKAAEELSKKQYELSKATGEAQIKKLQADIENAARTLDLGTEAQKYNQGYNLYKSGAGTPTERSSFMSNYSPFTTEKSVTIDGVGTLSGDEATKAREKIINEIISTGNTGTSSGSADYSKTLQDIQNQIDSVFIPGGFGALAYPGYQANVRKKTDLENLYSKTLEDSTKKKNAYGYSFS